MNFCIDLIDFRTMFSKIETYGQAADVDSLARKLEGDVVLAESAVGVVSDIRFGKLVADLFEHKFNWNPNYEKSIKISL